MSRCRPSGLNSIPAATCARQAVSDCGEASLAAARRSAISAGRAWSRVRVRCSGIAAAFACWSGRARRRTGRWCPGAWGGCAARPGWWPPGPAGPSAPGGKGQLLGDHAAETGPQDARLLDAGMVQDRHDILGHGTSGEASRWAVGGADAAVVDGDDLEPAGQPVDQHQRPTRRRDIVIPIPVDGCLVSRDAQAARPACDAWSRAACAGGLGRSYFACPRRAAISSSLLMEERPSISSSRARSRSSSMLRSS
jgi:hypothetical protein